MSLGLDKTALVLNISSIEKGFYKSLNMSEFNSQAKQLMMVTSEVVEVMEALRKDKGEQEVMDELADIVIRVLDFYQAIKDAGVVSQSLDEAVIKKHEKNLTRPHMHGVKG